MRVMEFFADGNDFIYLHFRQVSVHAKPCIVYSLMLRGGSFLECGNLSPLLTGRPVGPPRFPLAFLGGRGGATGRAVKSGENSPHSITSLAVQPDGGRVTSVIHADCMSEGPLWWLDLRVVLAAGTRESKLCKALHNAGDCFPFLMSLSRCAVAFASSPGPSR
jgi:hypothetical protein